jgi:glycosyltransferase involved in cell wall biosynthesis
MKPLITVVIPTRNRPVLLLRAVRSVLAQTWPEIEVIVVVDGDKEGQCAKTIAGIDRVSCIALAEPVGGAEARNIGIRSARAEWIALLDDDDEWLAPKLETQMSAIERHAKNKKALVVACQHLYRTEDAPDVVRPRRLPRPDEDPCEFMFDYLCYFQTSTFLCSKDLMLRIPFKKGLAFFQDIDWFLRAMRAEDTEFLVVPQPLAIYHAPQERKTTTNSATWEAKLDWGRANRTLMSGRSYSRFIVGSCVGPAAQARAGIRGFGRLFYECAIMGSPTPLLLALLTGTYLLSPPLRRKLRDRVLLKRVHRHEPQEQHSVA